MSKNLHLYQRTEVIHRSMLDMKATQVERVLRASCLLLDGLLLGLARPQAGERQREHIVKQRSSSDAEHQRE